MTQKQLKEQVRIECHKYYKKLYTEKLEKLESENKRLQDENWKAYTESSKIRRENVELKEKLAKFEDWNRRLQEFMDMSDEDRNRAFKEMKDRAENTANMNSLLKTLGGMANLMYGF